MRQRLNNSILAVSTFAALLALAGCHDDMWIQPKVHKPLQQSDFFVDEQTARPLIKGTVARETYFTDDELHTGFRGKKLTTEFPFEITKDDLKIGQEKFNIFCSPCHGALGYGDGMIAKRGFAVRRHPGNYHTESLRKAPVGHFYDVISHGFGTMFSYAARIPDPKDRWRIVAYVRVLQFSQNAKESDLPPGGMEQLLNPTKMPAEGGAEH